MPWRFHAGVFFAARTITGNQGAGTRSRAVNRLQSGLQPGRKKQ